MSTFNSARYNALLEGLEATVIKKSQLNSDIRFEAEFFRKRYLAEESALTKWPAKAIGEFATVTDGPHGYHVVDEDSPVAMLTAKTAKDWFAERESAETIAKATHEANLRSSLEDEDIILSTRGTVGCCAIVLPEVLPANLDQDVARISWNDRQEVLPEYVLAYLNSTFGQDHIHRYATGMVQQGLSLQKVREIPIPLLSRPLQKRVKAVVRSALESRRKATSQLDLAEEVLLGCLNLKEWHPPESLSYISNSAAVVAAGRCDAEFFYPAKAAVVGRLQMVESRPLGELYESIRELFDPSAQSPELRVRNFDVTDALQPVLDDSKEPARAADIGSTKKVLRKGDVAVSRLRSYLKEIALVQTSTDSIAVGSSEFIVLRPRPAAPWKLAPESLMAFLRSAPVQTILKWSQDGSNHPRFGEEVLLAISVPRKVVDSASQINATIRGALNARSEAKALLERAKRLVEIAIEHGEEAADTFLSKN